MKRDLETVRHILSRVESYDSVEIEGGTAYHLSGLMEQGYVTAKQILIDGRIHYYEGLTLSWEGHELLGYISNSFVWESIKVRLSEHNLTVNDVPVEIIKKISSNIMADMFGGNDTWK